MGLMTCPDCKNTVSTDAASCPKCGKPLRRPPWVRLVRTGAIAGLVLMALLVIVNVIRRYEAIAEDRSHQFDPPRGAPRDPPRQVELTPEERAVARAKLARDAWDEFDRLPESMRTLAMIQAFLLKANQFADGVDEPWATQIRVGTEGNARGRVALLFGGAVNAEEPHTIFVLAKDPSVCASRKPQFEAGTKNAEILKSWGFGSLRCPGTGNTVSTMWSL